MNNSHPNIVLSSLASLLTEWSDGHLLSTEFSGSLAKGGCVSSGNDVDIFVSLSSVMLITLIDMH